MLMTCIPLFDTEEIWVVCFFHLDYIQWDFFILLFQIRGALMEVKCSSLFAEMIGAFVWPLHKLFIVWMAT